MQIDVPTMGDHDLFGMRDSLRGMVGKKIDDTTKETLANLTDQIAKQVEDDMRCEYNDWVTACQDNVAVLDGCCTAQQDRRGNTLELIRLTEESRKKHALCRSAEQQLCQIKDDKVSAFRSTVKEMMASMRTNNRHAYTSDDHTCPVGSGDYADHKPGYLAIDGVTDPVPMFMRQEHAFYMTYQQAYKEGSAGCKMSSDVWKQKACECDALQHDFEADFCKASCTSDVVCRDFDTCRLQGKVRFNIHYQSKEERETNWKNQWTALDLLKCYSEMIHQEITDFSHCGDRDVDTDQWNLPPCEYDECECPPFEAHKPCDKEWTDEEYGEFCSSSDYDRVTIAPCQSCPPCGR